MDREEVLTRLAEEARIRSASAGEVDFVQLERPLADRWPVIPGTLLVVWSTDAALLGQARSLSLAGDGRGLYALLTGAPSISEDAIAITGDIFDHVEAIGELSYGERSILTGATTPPWIASAFDRIPLAFSGGELDGQLFRSRSFVLPGSQPLTFLVIANPSEPDPDDVRILAALSGEQVGLGIEPANTLVVGAVSAAVATAVVDHYVDRGTDRVDRDVAQWAKNRQREQQRERQEARQRVKNHQAAERVRYRNISFVPGETAVANPPGEPPRTLLGLLAARQEMLGLAARTEFPELD